MLREILGAVAGSRVYGEQRGGNADLADTVEPPPRSRIPWSRPRARGHRGAAPRSREQPHGDCAWATGQGPSPHARGKRPPAPAPFATNSRAPYGPGPHVLHA